MAPFGPIGKSRWRRGEGGRGIAALPQAGIPNVRDVPDERHGDVGPGDKTSNPPWRSVSSILPPSFTVTGIALSP